MTDKTNEQKGQEMDGTKFLEEMLEDDPEMINCYLDHEDGCPPNMECVTWDGMDFHVCPHFCVRNDKKELDKKTKALDELEGNDLFLEYKKMKQKLVHAEQMIICLKSGCVEVPNPDFDGPNQDCIPCERLIKTEPKPTPKRTMEIIGVDGKVHYRRPEGDPLIDEALKTGLTVRPEEKPPSQVKPGERTVGTVSVHQMGPTPIASGPETTGAVKPAKINDCGNCAQWNGMDCDEEDEEFVDNGGEHEYGNCKFFKPIPADAVKCKTCDGSGYDMAQENDGDRTYLVPTGPCPDCGGRGWMTKDQELKMDIGKAELETWKQERD